MVGIAGGIPSQKHDVRLGDVAVSFPGDNCGGVRQHDFGKTLEGGEFHRTGFLNRPPNSILSAVSLFRLQIDLERTRFPRSVRDVLEKDSVLKNKCSAPGQKTDRLFKANQPHPPETICAQHPVEWDVARAQLASDAPNVHYGTVVSGNSVVKSAAIRDSLLQDIPDAVCVKMDASGLMNDFPCIVVRGICDYCDSYKNDQWQGYAALAAATYAKELLKFLPAQEIAEEILALKVYPLKQQSVTIFFKHGEKACTLSAALCAILHQLFSQQPHLIQHAMTPWDKNGEMLREDTHALWRILIAATGDPTACSTVCVLDALDECPEVDLEQLLSQFNDFYENSRSAAWADGLKFLVTSRPYHAIRSAFDSLPSDTKLESHQVGELIKAEVNLLIKAKVKELVSTSALPRAYSQDVQLNLEKQLCRAENPTYLWVHLAIEYIRSNLPRNLRPKTMSIPHLPPTLKGIPGVAESPRSRTLAESALDQEILEATIREICDPFVVIKDYDIHFLHETAREFLLQDVTTLRSEQKFSFSLLEAEELMTDICVLYLLMDDLEDATGLDKSVHQSLRWYAAENWADHLKSLPLSSQKNMGGSLYRLYIRSTIWANQFWEMILPREHVPKPTLPIHLVALNGHLDVLRKLIDDNIVRANQADDIGTTALIWSSYNGHYEVSELLLREGANVNAESQRLGTPLPVASLKGHKELVKLFLDNGAEVNHICGPRWLSHYPRTTSPEFAYIPYHRGSALWAACLRGHLEIVELLVEKGARELNFALMAASRGGNIDMIQVLMDNGADVNVKDEDGYYGTALQAASIDGHLETVGFLLQNGAEDEKELGYHGCALDAAYCNDNFEIMKLLIAWDAKGLYDAADYNAIFQSAADQGDLQTLTYLLDFVPDATNPGPIGDGTALLQAAKGGHIEIVRFLIEKSSPLDIHDNETLVAAAAGGHTEVLKIFMDEGADVDARDTDGYFLLWIASSHGHLDTVELLIEYGADVNLQHKNCTAIDIARQRDREDIEKCILETGEYVERINSLGELRVWSEPQ
ncbi:ankyrin repeat-containing domain protein [Aspergillus insuetus]